MHSSDSKMCIKLICQDVYQIDMSSITKGRIPVRENTTNAKVKQLELTADDCSDLGRYCIRESDHQCTISWMNEVLFKSETEQSKRVEKELFLNSLHLQLVIWEKSKMFST